SSSVTISPNHWLAFWSCAGTYTAFDPIGMFQIELAANGHWYLSRVGTGETRGGAPHVRAWISESDELILSSRLMSKSRTYFDPPIVLNDCARMSRSDEFTVVSALSDAASCPSVQSTPSVFGLSGSLPSCRNSTL